LSDQLQSSANQINDFGVINFADSETWVFRELNIIICVGFSTLSFYAINIDVVSLFTGSPFLLLAMFIVSMYSINLNEWILFLFMIKKKSFLVLLQSLQKLEFFL